MTWQTRQSWRSGDDPNIYEATRPVTYARGFTARGVVIEAHYNFPGSPAPAFGRRPGENDMRWPVASVRVPFQVGEEAKRDDFIRQLQAFIDHYFQEHARDSSAGERGPTSDVPSAAEQLTGMLARVVGPERAAASAPKDPP